MREWKLSLRIFRLFTIARLEMKVRSKSRMYFFSISGVLHSMSPAKEGNVFLEPLKMIILKQPSPAREVAQQIQTPNSRKRRSCQILKINVKTTTRKLRHSSPETLRCLGPMTPALVRQSTL